MGFQNRMIERLPAGVQAHPLEASFVALAIPSGILGLIGVARSPALENALPRWAHIMWAVSLLVGCIAWGNGLLRAKYVNNGHVTIVFRQVDSLILGLSLVSVSCFVYAAAILTFAGWSGIPVAVPLLTFAIGTYIRRIKLASRAEGES